MIQKIPQETRYYHFHNENPKGKRTSDCVIRALSTTFGKSWDTVIDELLVYTHKYKQMLDCPECYHRYLKDNCYVKVGQPKRPDNSGKKCTGREIVASINEAKLNYPVFMNIGAHHVVSVALINTEMYSFRIFDTWDSSNGKVGIIWVHEDDLAKWLNFYNSKEMEEIICSM